MGNAKRFDQIIEIVKRENAKKYKEICDGLKKKMSPFMKKVEFVGKKDLNEFVYFIAAINDILGAMNDCAQIRDFFLSGHVFYTMLMVITQPTDKFIKMTAQQRVHVDHRAQYQKIDDLKIR